MTRPVVVLRPEPGCGETVAAARSLGLEAIASPLFEVEPVEWSVPDPAEFDAILVGSANAFRHGGAGLERLRTLPVLAVGARTADAARERGFLVQGTGEGGLQALIDLPDMPRRLLRLSGEARVTLEIPHETSIDEVVVYRTIPLPLSEAAVGALRRGAVALLHSGEAARHFANECDRLAIARSDVAIAVLAPRIAAAAGEGWAKAAVAADVTDAALLALAADMCH
ncbi:uroporphyrinogen-III synthase [Tsuneonella dongtanensis]|uniref:Uroporphyrinogen-III synthase n=1 Tax=Tsuneonella dongtanensis TaxID=692370 RepID=A0A1B2AFP6_9SPHN|nr:uroporphyrinogen-III synthase [Tsuneonella dongtanensis]ANY20977.1 uroporphyrinogen-III synthase [Tsuneonella dongtanensis]